MRAAQAGDQRAYAELLSVLLPFLRSSVRREWRDSEDVEDIVQEILISVHSVRHTYDPGRPVMPWLMTIVSRRITDLARRKGRKNTHEIAVETLPETFRYGGANTEAETREAQNAIGHALNGLPEGQRTAFELMKIRGHSLEEASAITGKSVATLKVTVHRAIKNIQRALLKNG
jgi:RNA polymerase sigma-70 factor (ECF subfamily)